MDSELTFKALSYAVIELLWVTALLLSLVSIRKESGYGEPIKGILVLTLAIVGFCAFIALISVYAQNTRSLKKIAHRVETVAFKDESRR
jgi:hypothetical protein